MGSPDATGEGSNFKLYFFGFIALVVILFFGFKMIFPEKAKGIYEKIKKALDGVKDGALAIFKLEKKVAFIAYSWGIWLMYCLMTYFIVAAFDETKAIGLLGSITMFTTGGIAMTIPMPGGTGSYHMLVPFVMEQFYNIKIEVATAYAVIFHGWQTLATIVVGAFSLIMAQILSDTNEEVENTQENS